MLAPALTPMSIHLVGQEWGEALGVKMSLEGKFYLGCAYRFVWMCGYVWMVICVFWFLGGCCVVWGGVCRNEMEVAVVYFYYNDDD